MVLPSTDSDELLAERFSQFFKEKISRIIDKFHTASSASADSPSSSVAFVKFTPISVQQAIKLVADSPSSTCVLDPIPTHLLKRCKSVIGPIIAQIINLSFDQGLFPDSLKHAQVKPLLKNSKLDADDLNSYRPISNLKFISKALERAAASQIQCYLAANNLNSIMQSAYRKNHSCETVLLKVCNDLLLALDCGQEAVLLMLDYSAAFDTLSHSILLLRLRNRFGFSSAAFDWIESYIKGRSHSFVIRGKTSANQELLRGVPQGSVLGPILFTVYSSPLEDIIKAHGFGHAMYADDTQVYAIVNRDDWPNVIPRLEACLQEISSWSSENGLSINEGKTELIHLASRHRTRSLLPPLIFNHSRLQPAKNARNLGVVIDNQLAMSIHIGKICRNAAYGLYKIGKIRPYLDQDTTERLVHAFVISHIDSCNGLLYGLPDTLICRLQRIQNSAARLITRTHSRESVSLILRNLHWLPVKDRLIFKLLVIAFKCQHKLAPLYLQQLLNEYHPIRQLRSSSRQLFVPLTVSTISYGHRAFQYAVPQLWNKLPINIKECSSLLIYSSLC